ncbi:MAG TPA: hypothetical protein VED20_03935, partial [Streptosporangiaceae bacterium]|nr:hypothetical protein [Streptosporangiaceae bacterium]
MPMNRRSRLYRAGLMSGLGALVAAIALFAAPSQAAHADSGCDCWIVTPTSANPATAPAGTSEVYSFTVTDDDPNETLETLTFTAPTTEFVITSATGPAGTTLSPLPAPSVTLTLLPSNATSNVGSSFSVSITALAPCTSSSGTWSLSDTDSLDNNEAVWSNSTPLSVSVSGQCSLAFTGQPAQTAINQPIMTGFNSAPPPVTVQLLDASGAPLDPSDFSAGTTEVTLSLQSNPTGATLTGNTATSSGGVASFTDLQINLAGVYDLAASARGFMPPATPSNFFTISGVIQPCGSSCSASQSTATTTASVTTSSASNDFLTLGVGGISLTCNHYTAVSDVAAFGVSNASGGSVAGVSSTVTLTLSASAVASSPRPLILWQVCYGSQTP